MASNSLSLANCIDNNNNMWVVMFDLSSLFSKLQFALSYHDPLYILNAIECNTSHKITKNCTM
jgi:hypothetical protein